MLIGADTSPEQEVLGADRKAEQARQSEQSKPVSRVFHGFYFSSYLSFLHRFPLMTIAMWTCLMK